MKILLFCSVLCLAFLLSGCGTVTVRPEAVPIRRTSDINIRIQRDLEDFFAFEESRDAGAKKKRVKVPKKGKGVVVEPEGM